LYFRSFIQLSPQNHEIFENNSWAAGGVDVVSVEWLNQVHNTKSIFHISKIEIWSNRAHLKT
jgi:hypothetical protein